MLEMSSIASRSRWRFINGQLWCIYTWHSQCHSVSKTHAGHDVCRYFWCVVCNGSNTIAWFCKPVYTSEVWKQFLPNHAAKYSANTGIVGYNWQLNVITQSVPRWLHARPVVFGVLVCLHGYGVWLSFDLAKHIAKDIAKHTCCKQLKHKMKMNDWESFLHSHPGQVNYRDGDVLYVTILKLQERCRKVQSTSLYLYRVFS